MWFVFYLENLLIMEGGQEKHLICHDDVKPSPADHPSWTLDGYKTKIIIVSPDKSRGYYGSCVRVVIVVRIRVHRDFLVFELQAT